MLRDNRTLLVVLMILILLILYVTQQDCNDPFIKELKELLSPLDPRFRTTTIKCGNRSYTENKKIIVLCLRDKDGKLYDRNTIIYVAIHEFAHLIQEKYDPDHGPEYQRIFDTLLTRAANLGIYNPHKPLSPHYCSIDIPPSARTPLKDKYKLRNVK